MNNSYYNTTRVAGAKLAEYEARAKGQEVDVMRYFRDRPDRLISPEQVHRAVMSNAPRRSVARALANLTANGILEKTDHQVTGKYGRPIYCWRFNPELVRPQAEMF